MVRRGSRRNAGGRGADRKSIGPSATNPKQATSLRLDHLVDAGMEFLWQGTRVPRQFAREIEKFTSSPYHAQIGTHCNPRASLSRGKIAVLHNDLEIAPLYRSPGVASYRRR